jgi:hypothetical protein
MAKSKLQVRRLTLPPLSDVQIQRGPDQWEDEDEDSRPSKEKEQMAWGIDLSIISGEGKHPRPHVHGVEPSRGSKFWASGDDEYSLEESDDEEIAVITLLEEAIVVGFSMKQLCQDEEELTQLKEDSMSKKVVDLWVANRRNKAKLWRGPLPPPRQSPLRTLGDAMAKAKIAPKKKLSSLYATKDHH